MFSKLLLIGGVLTVSLAFLAGRSVGQVINWKNAYCTDSTCATTKNYNYDFQDWCVGSSAGGGWFCIGTPGPDCTADVKFGNVTCTGKFAKTGNPCGWVEILCK